MITSPTPQEVAQWALEAHVLDMAGALEQVNYEAVLEHLASVSLAAGHQDLLQQLSAMTDLATEFAFEIVLRDQSADRALELIRDGRRMWSARPMPDHPADIGSAPARSLACDVATLAIQACQTHQWEAADEQRFHEDLTILADRLRRQPRHQLPLIEQVLHDYEHALGGTAPAPPLASFAPEPTADASIDAIWRRFSAIADAAASIHRACGTSDRAWAQLSRMLQPDPGPHVGQVLSDASS